MADRERGRLYSVPLVDGIDAGRARVELDRHAQRARERLEHRLALVVRVVAAQVVDVQRHQRVVDEALEELVRQVDVERRRSCARVNGTCIRGPGRPEKSITTRDSASSSGT